MSKIDIRQGHVLDVLAEMPADSVDCVVTSPPYWGLRDYKIPAQVWGAVPNCPHQWGTGGRSTQRQRNGASGGIYEGRATNKLSENITLNPSTGAFCDICEAWRGDFGLEPTPELYIEHAVLVFRAVHRVLKPAGTLWLNIGDSYATGAGKVGECPGGGERGARWAGDLDRLRDAKRGYRGERLANGRGDQPAVLRQKTRATRDGSHAGKHTAMAGTGTMTQPNRMPIPGLKPKDMVCMPWRLGLALQSDGWYLRQDIIWSKSNPMPESVRDRCTKAHEYLLLLTKSERYYFDYGAIMEPCASGPSDVRKMLESKDRLGGKHKDLIDPLSKASSATNIGRKRSVGSPDGRNKRSVWEIATEPYPGAHYATFPQELVKPCVLAGCPSGGTVLDPFAGSGTTLLVAEALNCNAIGIELGAQSVELAQRRVAQSGIAFEEETCPANGSKKTAS
jgi:DNA modification methylase